MARYRFAWTNLPPAVLRALKRDLELEGDTSAVLRKTYGARPAAAFIEDAWPTLREHWLTRDRVARSSVIASLRERRLGDPSIATRSNAGQLDYLRSCRNAGALREIVAKALVTAGETSSSPPSKTRPEPRSRAWQGFVTKLAESLSALTDDEYLILQRNDRPWFVQFAAQGAYGMRAELVSNSFLQDADQLPAASLDLASRLGWSPPTGSPESSTPDADPDGSPNYFREWSRPIPYLDVAKLAVDTLVDVLVVSHPAHLQYDAFAEDGSKILIPTLGSRAKRQDGPAQPATSPESADADAPQILSSILEMLQRVSGNPELEFDDDGDIPLRYGSTMAFVRAFGDPPVIRVYSPVLRQVTGGAGVDGSLAQLNRDSVFIKWVADEGTLFASIDVFGSPLQLDHVLSACGVVGTAADDLDEQLQERFGGSTFFGEFKPKPVAIGGYL